MISLNIILVGSGDDSLAQIRREVLNNNWEIEAECPTAEKVLERAAALRDRPRLFIVLTPGQAELEQIKLLSSRFAGFPIIAVADSLDQKILLDLMRAGATQIVALPLHAEDFKAALTQISVQFGRPGTGAQMIAVAGVNGGCGATTIAANLAYEVAFLHKRQSVLVDLSLRLGQAHVCLDVKPKYSLADLAGYGDTLDAHLVQQVLHRVTDQFSLLPGPCGVVEGEACSPSDALRIVDICRGLGEVIVLDVPCTYDRFYFEAIATADKVILVAEQTVASVRALALVWDRLKRERPAESLFALFNRYSSQAAGFEADKLASLLNVPKVFSIPLDLQLRSAADYGGPLRVRASRSPILGDLARLACDVLGMEEAVKEPRRGVAGFLKKLGIG